MGMTVTGGKRADPGAGGFRAGGGRTTLRALYFGQGTAETGAAGADPANGPLPVSARKRNGAA